MVVVRHKYVNASAGGQFDLGAAARAAVGGHDERPPLRHCPFDGSRREAVTVGQPLWRVRLGVQTEMPQGQHEYRHAREAVRVEVAIDEDPLVRRPRPRHSLKSGLGVGEQPRIVQPLLGRREKRRQGIGVDDAASGEDRQQPFRDAPLGGQCPTRAIDRDGHRSAPAVQGLDHADQHATPGSTPAYLRIPRPMPVTPRHAIRATGQDSRLHRS